MAFKRSGVRFPSAPPVKSDSCKNRASRSNRRFSFWGTLGERPPSERSSFAWFHQSARHHGQKLRNLLHIFAGPRAQKLRKYFSQVRASWTCLWVNPRSEAATASCPEVVFSLLGFLTSPRSCGRKAHVSDGNMRTDRSSTRARAQGITLIVIPSPAGGRGGRR